jgi:hypothetical protein
MVVETAMLTPCLERKVADNAAFNLPTSWRVQRMKCDAMDMERLLSILDSGPVVLGWENVLMEPCRVRRVKVGITLIGAAVPKQDGPSTQYAAAGL